MIKELKIDKLGVKVYENRTLMGEAAAERFHDAVTAKLKEKPEVNIIFAAAPSQNDFLESIKKYDDIEWERINVFHMDEYVGLSIDDEQSFARFVKTKVTDNFNIKEFFALNGANPDKDNECARYSALLKEKKVDIVCCGIGENAHLAFNDPGVAEFNDSKLVKVIALDEVCRNQQVHDGCFKTLDDVPKYAMTLTIPALMAADVVICVVPCSTKADAVFGVVKGDITEDCPATAMRMHDDATMYLDKDSAAKI